jgi:hypothetical protein
MGFMLGFEGFIRRRDYPRKMEDLQGKSPIFKGFGGRDALGLIGRSVFNSASLFFVASEPFPLSFST